MADEIMHTVLPSSGGNAWGGSALGAGVGSQLFQTNAIAQQTAAIINALKPATTTAG